MKIICMIRSLCLGGAERQLSGLAISLKGLGHDVEVLTYHEGDFYAGMLDEAGVRRTLIPKDRHILDRLETHFRAERPNLVIAFLVGPSVKACRVKRRFPEFKLAVSERNVNTWTGPHDHWRFHIFRDADFIIPNSHAQADYIRKHFPLCAPKLRTIVNFVDTAAFSPLPHEEGNPKVIVTTARVDSRKNVHGYLRALSLLKARGYRFDARWYGLKGEGDRYYRKCLKMVSDLGLGGCFHILPATKEVALIYRNADIFCLPSFYEGTPNALAEALASGLPAVASDVSDNGRYVLPGENGCLCKPSDLRSIAAALEQILGATPSERAAMSRRSRDIAESKLSPEVFREAYASLLAEVS